MKNNKVLFITVIILLFCICFTSCGVNQNEEESDLKSGTDVSEKKESEEPKEVGPTTQEEIDRIMSESEDMIEMQEEHENVFVYGVKNGSPNDFPDITYGEVFDYFFDSPKWTAFEGVKEGETKAYDIVEFTGTMKLPDEEVKALIQFTISDDFETFEWTYCSLNDIPIPKDNLGELVYNMFYEYGVIKQMNSQKATPSS